MTVKPDTLYRQNKWLVPVCCKCGMGTSRASEYSSAFKAASTMRCARTARAIAFPVIIWSTALDA